MPTFVNIFAMEQSATYLQQVTVACRIAAQNIINESTGTANHTNRIAWAKQLLKGDQGLLAAMATACSMNATLQNTAPAGPWVDSDIQFTVNSLIDIQSS